MIDMIKRFFGDAITDNEDPGNQTIMTSRWRPARFWSKWPVSTNHSRNRKQKPFCKY
jgi:hypothetical protein